MIIIKDTKPRFVVPEHVAQASPGHALVWLGTQSATNRPQIRRILHATNALSSANRPIATVCTISKSFIVSISSIQCPSRKINVDFPSDHE